MSIFGSIMDKIFHHPAASAASAPRSADTTPATAALQTTAARTAPAQAEVPALGEVDVAAVLNEMAKTRGGGGGYKVSIVDLLKLLELDSSLDARKQLADELNVHAGEAGSAEENVALHKAVLAKLAENGGRVPDSMK